MFVNQYILSSFKNRFDKVPTVTVVGFDEMVEKLRTPVLTKETVEEYKTMSSDEKGEAKDVGAFVLGVFNGTRSNQNIISRGCVCLDIDEGAGDIWDTITRASSNSMIMYSTHSHTPEAPRYRVICFLSMEVTPEQYIALARIISKKLGIIDMADASTYQPARMMYYPSVPKDGEYIFKVQHGQPFDVSALLAENPSWNYTESLPKGKNEKQIPTFSNKKLDDPREKQGPIGAFCKSYTIQQAIIKFLPDVYLPTSRDDRWTYSQAASNGGLVVYNGIHAYSNHTTDPICDGHAHNAFDLVRIHKFGHLDKEQAKTTRNDRLPSYNAMVELCEKDERVMALLKKDEPEKEEDGDWMKKIDLEVTNKGVLIQSIKNAKQIIANDPALKGAICLDEFQQLIVKTKSLPWWRLSEGNNIWSDMDEVCLREYLEGYGLTNKDRISDAVQIVALENKFHPIKDYLNGLEWDGKPRVDSLFIDYMGAEDNAYTRQASRMTFCAGVARIFQPGIKFDTALILEGSQGQGKSTIFAKLGMKWFTDSITEFRSKDSIMQLQASWIIELGEMAATTKKSDVEIVKSFISRQTDRYRKAYGKNVTENKRQCIFFGTSNNTQFINDTTGGRRFLPIHCDVSRRTLSVFEDFTQEEVDQVWAEAVQIYKEGKTALYLTGEALEIAKQEQERYTFHSDTECLVERFLNTKVPANYEFMKLEERIEYFNKPEEQQDGRFELDRVCITQIYREALGGKGTASKLESSEIVAALVANGWQKTKSKRCRVKGYGPMTNVYEKIN